jgi:hypothetical protein
MQPSAPVQSETAKVHAALTERLSGFPLIAARTPREEVDQRLTRQRAAHKAAPRRFTGELPTGFGGLL